MIDIPVVNDEIFLDAKTWANIKDNYPKDEIIESISSTIESEGVPFPIKNTTLTEAKADFKKLQEEDSLKYIKRGEFFHRYDYTTPFSDIYIGSSLAGLKSSNYFNFQARMACDSINSPSPYRTWRTHKFRKSMLGALFSLKLDKVDPKALATCIAMRKYIAAQFRPSCAKCIYELFNAKDILDFSSGWGDRLSAFMATGSTRKYVGIDPNATLFDGYTQQMGVMNGELGLHKDITMINAPAETAEVNGEFDLIFTSPPYFNIERYTQEENQSFKKYRKLNVWLESFLFFSINKYWHNLKDGGILAINIGDVYSNHTVNQICDPMNQFIATLNGANYLGCIGYKMQKRLRSKSDKEGIFAEPIWIWGKNVKGDISSVVNERLGTDKTIFNI